MKLKNFFIISLVFSIVLFNTNVKASDVIFACEACPESTMSDEVTDSCIPCSAGTYASGTGNAKCTSCSAGTYSTGGASSCKNCLTEGVATCDIKTGKATSCKKGYSFNSSNGTCTICSAGYYSAGGTTSCSKCPKGNKCPSKGMSSPTPCTGNEYQDKEGQTSCLFIPSSSSKTCSGHCCNDSSVNFTDSVTISYSVNANHTGYISHESSSCSITCPPCSSSGSSNNKDTDTRCSQGHYVEGYGCQNDTQEQDKYKDDPSKNVTGGSGSSSSSSSSSSSGSGSSSSSNKKCCGLLCLGKCD